MRSSFPIGKLSSVFISDPADLTGFQRLRFPVEEIAFICPKNYLKVGVGMFIGSEAGTRLHLCA